MNNALKSLRIVNIAMIAYSLALIIMGEWIGSKHPASKADAFFFGITLVVIFLAFMVFLLRRTMVATAERIWVEEPSNAAALTQLRAGYLMIFIMSEAVILFGFMLRAMRFSFIHVASFYAVGLVMLVYFFPRTVLSARN